MSLEDNKILETIPVGPLGIISLESCKELGEKIDNYITEWRNDRTGDHTHTIAFSGYQKDSFLVNTKVPRFGSGEAKGLINESLRGKDLYILLDNLL